MQSNDTMCTVNWECISQPFHITVLITGKQLQCLKQVHEETYDSSSWLNDKV